MKPVTVKMNAGDLKGIIDLPNYPDNQLVDITIKPSISEKDFDNLLKEIKTFWDNHEKPEEKSFDEYRMERLEARYGTFN